jgi:hypothetical protein
MISAFVIMLVSGFVSAMAGTTDDPTPWSSFPVFNTYTAGGIPITDHEGASDPTNGGAAVRPASADIGSCSADGAAPGSQPSVLWAYFDGDTPFDPFTPSTMDDDFVLFRLRMGADPTENGAAQGFVSSTWDVLIDIDNDGYKEFVLAIDGTATSQGEDTLWVFYNDGTSNSIDEDTDTVDTFVAAGSGGVQTFNHVTVRMDGDNVCDGSNQYWFDFQVPLVAFDDLSGTQLIYPNTPLAMFYSTARSNSDPLQKDLMMDPGTTTPLTSPITFGDTITFGGGATLIELVSFTADGRKNSAAIGWETASEIDTAGFHLWRTDASATDYSRITDAIIPALGGAFWGAEYGFEDTDVLSGTTYFYKLQDIDYGGRSGLHGPVRATVGAPDILNLAPPNKAGVPITQPPEFRWKTWNAARFRLQFSRSPDFSGAVTAIPAQCSFGPGWISGKSYTPTILEWQRVWDLPPEQRGLYWRVVGENADSEPVASAPTSITVFGQGGGK